MGRTKAVFPFSPKWSLIATRSFSLDLSFQISPIQEDIQFIEEGFPGVNLQIRKKDMDSSSSEPPCQDILRESCTPVSIESGGQGAVE